ncbi:MAG: co-chaperone GroES, partial [Candidatus Omnitrophota bacterium]|nr:co-chaperone GroES [Candidatus Omnitrophota bacterium]
MLKKASLQPLGDFLFLQWDRERETKSGVILSDTSRSKPAVAKVVAIGPGRMDRTGNFVKTSLKVGDKVVVDPFVPQVIKI